MFQGFNPMAIFHKVQFNIFDVDTLYPTMKDYNSELFLLLLLAFILLYKLQLFIAFVIIPAAIFCLRL